MIRPMRPGGRVVCVGDVMLDISAALPGPLVTGSDTPAPISFGHGGSAANTAAWLANLGVPCVFAGRVGDDAFGRDAVAALRSHGVTPKVSIDPHRPTGVCLVLVGPDGERTMVPSAGANAALSPADLGDDLLTAEDHLHLSGYTLLEAGSREAALFALRLAGSVGASVSVDAASAGPIRTVGAQRFLDWIPAGVLLLANVDELATLTGMDDRQQGLAVLVRRQLAVVLKCGSEGSTIATATELGWAAAAPARVRDTTGAGDAFAAGLLAARWSGTELPESMVQANQLGAAAVGRRGARP
jgi:sugar/nucleoside kinase (ribokinase family)